MMTLTQISNEYPISRSTAYKRAKRLNIHSDYKKYNKDEIEMITYIPYSRNVTKRYRSIIHSPIAIDVIEAYKSTKENSIKDIAQKLNIGFWDVNRILTFFLEDNCLIIESKL